MKVGVSFNTLGDSEDDEGTTLVNKGGGRYSGPPCTRCGRNNHSTEKCFATKKADGTMLHVDGTASNTGDEDKVSNANDGAFVHKVHELMFIQPFTSPSSKTQRSSSN